MIIRQMITFKFLMLNFLNIIVGLIYICYWLYSESDFFCMFGTCWHTGQAPKMSHRIRRMTAEDTDDEGLGNSSVPASHSY